MKYNAWRVRSPAAARRWKDGSRKKGRPSSAIIDASAVVEAANIGEAITKAMDAIPGANANNLIVEPVTHGDQ